MGSNMDTIIGKNCIQDAGFAGLYCKPEAGREKMNNV